MQFDPTKTSQDLSRIDMGSITGRHVDHFANRRRHLVDSFSLQTAFRKQRYDLRSSPLKLLYSRFSSVFTATMNLEHILTLCHLNTCNFLRTVEMLTFG